MERLNASESVAGLKQSVKKVSQGLAKQAYVAEDADSWVIEPFMKLCSEKQVPVELVPSMKELAKACHVEVPTACAVLL